MEQTARRTTRQGSSIRLVLLSGTIAVVTLGAELVTLLDHGSGCSPAISPDNVHHGRTQLLQIVLAAGLVWLVAWLRTGRRVDVAVAGGLAAIVPVAAAVWGITTDSAWLVAPCIQMFPTTG